MDITEKQFFQQFTEINADRYTILWDYLESSALSPKTIQLNQTQHILLGPQQAQHRRGQPKVLIAHYDCVSGSPGANDNGAAVLQLIMAAKRLLKEHIPNWYILFTDKEERKAGSSISSQGSYFLAQGFKTIGFKSAHCYIFDACGRGNTLILSTALEELARNAMTDPMAERILQTRKLRSYALETARLLLLRKVLLLPTPFSDDLGFLSAGLTAQTITMLPEEEAQTLLQHHRGGLPVPSIPTWQYMNTPLDRLETLTAEGFSIIPDFAYALCANSR